MNNHKKHGILMNITLALVVITFAMFVIGFIKNGDESLKSYLGILPSVFIGVLLRIMRNYYYKKGYFTARQAKKFYERCKNNNVDFISKSNLELIRDIYRETVYEINSRETEKIDEYELYKRIYSTGKKYTEKQSYL